MEKKKNTRRQSIVITDALNYFKTKCDDTYVKQHDVHIISADEIDKMFVLEEDKVENVAALNAKIEKGGKLDVMDNFTMLAGTTREDRPIFYKDATVNFHDNIITVPSTLNAEDGDNWCALYVEEGATVVFDGTENGGISIDDGVTDENKDGPYCITNFGGNVTIKGGKYVAHGCCVYGYAGKTVIEGGFFEASPIAMSGHETQPWTLNLLNEAHNNGTASFEVKGGTFVNFDPSNPKTDDATSYVATGYKVVEEKRSDTITWYHVVPDTK